MVVNKFVFVVKHVLGNLQPWEGMNAKTDTINYGDYSIRMVINMVVMFEIVAHGFFEVQDIVTCFNDLCFKNFLLRSQWTNPPV